MTPPLSIIVPCLNEAAGIARTLEDLKPLRERGVEVIVVDGGSGDQTLPLAAPLADRAMVATRGRAAQMNAGAGVARGAVLLFLHADCRLPANADKLIVDGFAKSAKRWGRFDVAFDCPLPMMRVVARLMNLRSRLTGIATGDQGMFVTRELFMAQGGFPDIPLMEDVALSKRLRKISPPLCLTARITTSARRWEKRGVLHTVLLMWRLRFAYFAGVDPAKLAVRYDSVRAHD